MKQIIVKTNKLNYIKDITKKQTAIFRLMCSLEYSSIIYKWYLGSRIEKEQLPKNESLIALSLYISSVGETLALFESIKDEFEIPDEEIEIKDKLNFLDSDEVVRLKKSHLKYIRDKITFHIDPEPIKQYMRVALGNGEQEFIIWKSDDNYGYSPLACAIIHNQIMLTMKAIHETGSTTNKVVLTLKDILFYLIEKNIGELISE